MEIIKHIDIPDNIADYVKTHNGTNLSFNINYATSNEGYAHIIFYTVVLSKLTRTCNRCGYDPLWKPNDDNGCKRHTYNNWRYDDVFVWSKFRNAVSLEKAFDEWLKSQPIRYDKPCKKMMFGQIGWS